MISILKKITRYIQSENTEAIIDIVNANKENNTSIYDAYDDSWINHNAISY